MGSTDAARRIVERYRHHAAVHAELWGLPRPGPGISVAATAPGGVALSLRGRSRTLAMRRDGWTWRRPAAETGAGGSTDRDLGDPGSGEPLDRHLQGVASVQALRRAVARSLGCGGRSMAEGRLLVDRSAALLLAATRGTAVLADLAACARRGDRTEIVPNETGAGIVDGPAGGFGVAGCEYDVRAGRARPPEARFGPFPVGATGEYGSDSLSIRHVALPDVALAAAAGMRLGDVAATGIEHLDRRTVVRATTTGSGTTLRLEEDRATVEEVLDGLGGGRHG